MRRPALLLALAVLSACQLSGLGGTRATDPAANPVTAGSITTTTLDAPAPATPAETTAPAAAASPASAPPTPETAPETPPEAATETTTDPAATSEPPEIPAILKSPSQLACEDDGGRWAKAGEGGGMACIFQTRDGGKSCDSKDDCQGECLARSRSCSPIRPLFGCNAVLLDTGAEVTLCLD